MSTINTLDFESKLTNELDKAIVQKSVTSFMADNSFRQKFVGARTVLVPDVDFSGLGDYDRDGGFTEENSTVIEAKTEIPCVNGDKYLSCKVRLKNDSSNYTLGL